MKLQARAPRIAPLLLPALAFGGALLAALWAADPAMAANHAMVAQNDLTFSPNQLTINVGDTVTFSNGGGIHNVVANGAENFRCANGCDGEGGNGNISGASWSFVRTFDNPGVVNIACQAHAASGMTATITVQGGGGGTPGQLRLVSAASSRNENSGNFSVQVERTGGDDGAVSVDYDTSDGSATAGSDYGATSGTLTFGDNVDGIQSFNVPIVNDGADENDETLSVSLSNPGGGATLGTPTTATLTIVDDDDTTPQPGSLAFSSATYQATENGGNATITVARSGGSSGAVSVNYSTSNGSGTAGNDYTPANGTLNWGNGDSANKTFQVPVLDDTALDGNKTVNLHLQNPGGGATLGTSAATLTIADNEQPACIPGERVLCLGENNRFEVKVHWMDFLNNMDDAFSVPIPGRRDSGLFYFFDGNNIEMLIKVLSGCHINNRFWVFYAATTDVAFHATVRDTVTGFIKAYDNTLGTPAAPVLDIDFEACQ
jgi:plastocyanin